MRWIELRASVAEIPEDWGPLVDAFISAGCPSAMQTDAPPTVSGCFPDMPGVENRLAEVEQALVELGAISFERITIVDEDWVEAFKKHFHPRRVGERWVIRPTWEDAEVLEGDRVIVLDPGQAFGTGDHPTTRLCLELMEDLEIAGQPVLDVGCGSGILSIGAKLLGAADVLGVDTDALSVEVSRENAVQNRVAATFVVGDGFSAPEVRERKWPIALSNIISATLIRISPDAASAIEPGGAWVVSGIIRGNWPDVLAAAEASGFALEKMLEDGEWVGATLRRSL